MHSSVCVWVYLVIYSKTAAKAAAAPAANGFNCNDIARLEWIELNAIERKKAANNNNKSMILCAAYVFNANA